MSRVDVKVTGASSHIAGQKEGLSNLGHAAAQGGSAADFKVWQFLEISRNLILP